MTFSWYPDTINNVFIVRMISYLFNYMRFIELFQVIISILLIVAILMQNRGSSLGSGFGGDSFASYHTKRGFEKFLVRATVFLAFFFLLLSLLNVWVK